MSSNPGPEFASGGRGLALIKALQKQREKRAAAAAAKVKETPEEESSVSENVPPQGPGKGRAALLALLKSNRQSVAVDKPVGRAKPMIRDSPTRDSTPECVDNVATPLKELSLNETPVNKRGTSGTPINLNSNYIKLQVEHGKGFFEYKVKFSPLLD